LAIYNEEIVVVVKDQSAAPLQTVQKNVDRAEASLNRVSAHPFAIVVKATDLLTRGLTTIMNTATSLVTRGHQCRPDAEGGRCGQRAV
jgi:hypothetical protein